MVVGAKRGRFLFWLALVTALMALAMGALLAFELTQKQLLTASRKLQVDSVTSLTFQAEREFLRFRQALEAAESGVSPAMAETLRLRYDIFLSRLALLQDNPSISVLAQRPEYLALQPALSSLVLQTDTVMANLPPKPAELGKLLASFNEIGPAFQALTQAASSEIAQVLERQYALTLEQNQQIVALTVAQLLLLLGAALALFIRHSRQETERLALQALSQELGDARVRADEANRGKSIFLANMSHELRTPFNGLMGMLAALEDSPLDAKQANYLDTAQASARHLLTLLNDILDISALEAGKINIQPKPVSLPWLLRDVGALMQPLAEGKGIGFSFELPPQSLPWVMADETRVRQILLNLINNAIKFTDSGQVQVKVLEVARSATRIELDVAVSDTGIGMAEHDVGQLFQRFKKAESNIARQFGGTGLGLEISQSLAQLMGGKITVHSQLAVGSTFTLHLRLNLSEALQAETPAPEPLAPVQRPRTEAVAEPALPPADETAPRVLLVEDHPINRMVAEMLLKRMGCQVTACANGQLAIDQVMQQRFDLVLMDINMPVMDGLSATRAIRALPGALARLPIVVLTADIMNQAEAQAMTAGAQGFLSKPIQFAQLQACVQQYLASDLPLATAQPGP
jgi:signal transduction histidine kinase/ActR/RegA family two-component response regulator